MYVYIIYTTHVVNVVLNLNLILFNYIFEMKKNILNEFLDGQSNPVYTYKQALLLLLVLCDYFSDNPLIRFSNEMNLWVLE